MALKWNLALSLYEVQAPRGHFVVPNSSPLECLFSGPSSKLLPTQPLSMLQCYLGRLISLLHYTSMASAMSFAVAGWPAAANVASQQRPPTFRQLSCGI